MTPEEKRRAERLAARLKAFANLNLQDMIYELCCDLEAISVAAMMARVFWMGELIETNPNLSQKDRFNTVRFLAGAVRVGTVANKAMVTLESLIRDDAINEVQRLVAWFAGPTSPRGAAGIDRFCEQVATTGLPDGSDSAIRSFLQRLYDSSPDEPEAKP